ncbi:MAG TPA: prepilin-type N-terminal cleavage/methylation domain-containing protein [Candidatus Saccharimonadales bacterium]|jgi:prepilin-type N-terminal cleavage/methylation domain-containing protein|nr:prepilin-type N-terminal cleavage/methylation domain-containing protein [Candidatus Saccharimonadales bacterium]
MTRQSKGFSIIELVIVLAVVLAAGLGGWYVWHESQPAKQSSNKISQISQNKSTGEIKQTDPYVGWQAYSNSAYGVNLKYPADWKLDEGSSGSPDSATKQEYAISLKRNEEVKYNNTVSIEILNEKLSDAEAWYDAYFAQSSSNHITRSTDQLKGKQSVQYAVTNSGVETKLYLFSVGDKTYLFSSINEELNTQTDSDYWAKFGLVFDSLQINS